MEINGDYHFDDFLKAGGASSDSAVSAFLSNKISKGFYSVEVENTGLACSTLSAKGPEGTHIWGRNFDWTGSIPIIVKCFPEAGYASISTCDFQNITSSTDVVTNLNLANDNTSAGGESAKERYEALLSIYADNDGVVTAKQMQDALLKVSQFEGECTTQWSVVYEQSSLSASYYFNGNSKEPYRYMVGK